MRDDPRRRCGGTVTAPRRHPDGRAASAADDRGMHTVTLVAILVATVLLTIAGAALVAPELGAMVLVVGPMVASMVALFDGAVSPR